jgi:hypothetical protein
MPLLASDSRVLVRRTIKKIIGLIGLNSHKIDLAMQLKRH